MAAERANTITGSRRADRAMKFVSNMFGSKNNANSNNSSSTNNSTSAAAAEKQDAKVETAPATGEPNCLLKTIAKCCNHITMLPPNVFLKLVVFVFICKVTRVCTYLCVDYNNLFS